MRWHILTGEYPPGEGGVADYTRLVAQALSDSGDNVEVWVPGHSDYRDAGVSVHGLHDHFGPRALSALSRRLRRERASYRLLVQYVPHAFGWKGSNVPFCLWLRAQPRATTWVMFHEVAFPIDRHQPLTHNGLGLVTRGMASLAASSASRIFVSIPAWEPFVRRSAEVSTAIEWMPVPSMIPVHPDPDVAAVRARFDGDRPIVGHFGTYGDLIRPLLFDVLREAVSRADVNVLLLGRGSDRATADLLNQSPELSGRVRGAGALPAADVSQHVAACAVMVQPYVDGVSARRTSVMVALSHGRPVATTAGELTEQVWRRGAVALSPAGDAAALAGSCTSIACTPSLGARFGSDGRRLYESRFDLRHTIAMLKGESPDDLLSAAS